MDFYRSDSIFFPPPTFENRMLVQKSELTLIFSPVIFSPGRNPGGFSCRPLQHWGIVSEYSPCKPRDAVCIDAGKIGTASHGKTFAERTGKMDLTITEFKNRKNPHGKVVTTTWSKLVNRFNDPFVTTESTAEYVKLSNEERTEIKDVGGYIGGECLDGNRNRASVKNRCLLTIDADNAKPTAVAEYEQLFDNLFLCHSTHSSTKEKPRLRWVFPLSRQVSLDEYRALVSIVKEWVGEESVDESTDQPERLMFWPSISTDGEWYFKTGGEDPIKPDEVLADYSSSGTPITERNSSTFEDHAVVPEGHRHERLLDLAGKLHHEGIGGDTLLGMLLDFNENYCDPPCPETEIRNIAAWVNEKRPGDLIPWYLRTPEQDFADLIGPKPSKAEECLVGESFADLCRREIPKPSFLIDSLIAPGLTILASPPKFGKSWMSLDMCISVATGTDFMGLRTSQTGVFYLAMEDGDYRLQQRGRIVNGGRPLPSNLTVIKEAPILDAGFLKRLKATIDHSSFMVGLVVIDTLQKIRGAAKRNEGVYGYDYRELGDLQKFAMKENLAIVLVHHLNKGKDDGRDSIARINGSTGISGAADTLITLTRSKRDDIETRMEITGRDVPARTLIIQFDESTHRWICLGRATDVAEERERSEFLSDPLVKTIVYVLDEAEDKAEETKETITRRLTVKEIRDLMTLHTDWAPVSNTWIGRQLVSYQERLKKYAGITFTACTVRRDRGYAFTRPTGMQLFF